MHTGDNCLGRLSAYGRYRSAPMVTDKFILVGL